MTGWQKDIFEGDYVRIVTVEEYLKTNGRLSDDDISVLRQVGGKAYQVEGCKYNGKILLAGDNLYAYPPEFLQPWHKDNFDGDVSETDFASLIGENYE